MWHVWGQVAITDAPIKRGMLLLRPEHVVVLGGEVSLSGLLIRLEKCSGSRRDRHRDMKRACAGREAGDSAQEGSGTLEPACR